jgi:hypothetical protein
MAMSTKKTQKALCEALAPREMMSAETMKKITENAKMNSGVTTTAARSGYPPTSRIGPSANWVNQGM